MSSPSTTDPPFDCDQGKAYFHRVEVIRHVLTLGDRRIVVAGVKEPADLLDHPDFAKRFIEEDRAPYGLELWPASIMLAEHIMSGQDGGGRSALELGCGLGLVSIAATLRGWKTTASDNDSDSLRFASYNAAHNDVEISAFTELDWHHAADTPRVDRVFAADVLYQLIDHEPVLRCISLLLSPGGCALIADPCRGVADPFREMALSRGFAVEELEAQATGRAGKRSRGRIFILTVDKSADEAQEK